MENLNVIICDIIQKKKKNLDQFMKKNYAFQLI